MYKIAIIADDLTGACDSGVRLIDSSNDVHVLLKHAEVADIGGGGEALSINTDTRNVAAETAYAAVADTVERILQLSGYMLYKKIDSTLRGNIAAEIDAMLDTTGLSMAIVTSAFPDNGRRIERGKLYCKNGPDDRWACSGHGSQDIFEKSRHRGDTIFLEDVREGAAHLERCIRERYANGAQIVVIDTKDNRDLEIIAQAMRQVDDIGVIPVGSAGLVKPYFSKWFPELATMGTPKHRAEVEPEIDGMLMIAIGSCHPQTVAQMRRFQSREDFHIYALRVDDGMNGVPDEEIDRMMECLRKDLMSGEELNGVVLTTEYIFNATKEQLSSMGDNISSDVVAATIAAAAERVFREFSFNRLIVSGGDTANTVFEKMGIHSIKLLFEPSSGIVIGTSTADNGKQVWVATKSGGFGSITALEETADRLVRTGKRNRQPQA